ncbi:hypothetical protein BVRB_5g117870 [Beta vulgaris subsp. vulgaris]|nr:hypothetical protein BVRB_5g117870 [Beta vulgaris subsp. vulgaris]
MQKSKPASALLIFLLLAILVPDFSAVSNGLQQEESWYFNYKAIRKIAAEGSRRKPSPPPSPKPGDPPHQVYRHEHHHHRHQQQAKGLLQPLLASS